jgi:WD40 repeat protein
VSCVRFSPDEQLIAVGSVAPDAHKKDGADTPMAMSKSGVNDEPPAVAKLGTVQIWDATTRREIRALHVEGNPIELAFNPDCRTFLALTAEMEVRVWDVRTWALLSTAKVLPAGASSFSFGSDGSQLIGFGNLDSTVKAWDSTTGKLIREYVGHTEVVTGVAFSPDRTRLATAAKDKTVRIWDTGTGVQLLVLRGHAGEVTNVSFSPDGLQLLSGSRENITRLDLSGYQPKQVRLWDSSASLPTTEFKVNNTANGQLASVGFSADGKRVYARDRDQNSWAWETASGLAAPTDEPIPNFPAATEAWTADRKLSARFQGSTVQLRDEVKWAKFNTEQPRRLMEFTKSDPDWHSGQADDAEKANNWFAARFHLRILAKLTPGDEDVKTRLTTAEDHLKLNTPAPPPAGK